MLGVILLRLSTYLKVRPVLSPAVEKGLHHALMGT